MKQTSASNSPIPPSISHPTSPAKDKDDTNNEPSSRKRNWRIAKELGRHVWPSLSPGATDEEKDHVIAMKQRVVASVSLMLAGKGVTIATPYMFKALVDTIPNYHHLVDSTTSDVVNATFLPNALVESLATTTVAGVPAVPFILLLSYGTSRTLSSLFQESRNAVFANVAQSAIRSVGRSTFDHVHSLDLQYHLNRNTGALGRIIERGNRSISFKRPTSRYLYLLESHSSGMGNGI